MNKLPLIAFFIVTSADVSFASTWSKLQFASGEWKLSRHIRGQVVENTVKVEWLLNHQFLRVHMKDVRTPANYEAIVYVGYDNTSERYVVH